MHLMQLKGQLDEYNGRMVTVRALESIICVCTDAKDEGGQRPANKIYKWSN